MRCLRLFAPLLFTSLTPAQDGGTLALGGLDPVELCRGREVEGTAELGVTHFLYKYRFASEASLRTFQQDPERYAIQLGGACGRMGPLSGRGIPDCFTLHDGRIYIFASIECREGFLKDPARFLQHDDAPPAADAAAQQAGAALLQRALAAHGGKNVITHWTTLQLERRTTAKTDQGERQDSYLLTVRQDAVRVDQSWGGYRYSTILQQDGGCFVGNTGKQEPMHDTGARELQLAVMRQPLVLLRRLCGEGAVLAAAGKGKVGDVDVDWLDSFADAARTTLAIDGDGKVVQLRYRGRGPQLWFGDEQWTFSDFRSVGGVLLPFHQELLFDGKAAAASAQQQSRILLDPELGEDFFAPKLR
jgi:YHS domain-containing protein